MSYLKFKKEDIFIDFGSGKGRVVFFVAQRRIKKVIGVELNNELIAAANNNLSNLKIKLSPIKFINSDAANYHIRDENIFFMFNPFGAETLKKILNNIKNSLSTNPRKIRIVYYTPMYYYLLNKQDWLLLERRILKNGCLVWSNKL